MSRTIVCEVQSGPLKVIFSRECGPLPCEIVAEEFGGMETTVVRESAPGMSLELEDGTKIFPAVAEIVRYEKDGVQYIEFNNMPWADAQGRILPHFLASVRHEIFPDGTAFSSGFFMSECFDPPAVKNFRIALSPDFTSFDDIRWAFYRRGTNFDGSVIQDVTTRRFLPRGENVETDGIFSHAAFNAVRDGGPSLCAEFFMEGGVALSGIRGENASAVRWHDGNPEIEWNFQTKLLTGQRLPIQWRNQWGWVIRPAVRSRRLPPMTMYHYIDNRFGLRYPSPEAMEALADSGCHVLVLHENWRLDPQDGGVPYDAGELKRVIETAHRHQIRVALYIRGNENTVLETAAAWFGRWLRRNFDGLYMDFGGPFCEVQPPAEGYIDGRICFRRHYINLRRLRECVGPDGLLYSHTGTHFSLVGISFATGYVSGEGERGLLIRDRASHEYFSMAAAVPGTMWTAAFPEYSSPLMIPFLAAAGQYPHSPLGDQCPSSSLAHPPEPGINDLCFRPLWKLWSFFRDEKDIEFLTDFNSCGVFPEGKECGHCLMISGDRSLALLVCSNFTGTERKFKAAPSWDRTDFQPGGAACWRLAPDAVSPGEPLPCDPLKLEVALPPHAAAAFFLTKKPFDFMEFKRPYHKPGSPGKAWLEEVEVQRKLREEPPFWKKVFLRVSLPLSFVTAFEKSLIADLFNNQVFLVEFQEDGSFRMLADIKTVGGGDLFPGDSSAEISLSDLLPPGFHRLGLYSTHFGEPYYSFVTAVLFNGEGQSYQLIFRNELEPDRAFLRWKTIL